MHRIDGPGNVNGAWVSEDAATLRPPTEFTHEWLNTIQEEFASFIEWAGLVLSKADNTQLRQALLAKFATLASPALTGNPTVPTQGQFDSSTKVANTAFVKSVGMQASNLNYIASTSTLTSAVAGGTVLLTGAGGYTLTLPALSGVPTGTRIEFFNNLSPTMAVARNGADVIYGNSSQTALTSISLAQGESLVLESNGVSNWLVVGGSAQLSFAGSFGASLSASGYQKLPSGLIIQWGQCNPTGSADAAVSFPIVFPNSILSVSVAASATSGSAGFANYNGLAFSGMNVGAYLNTGARAAYTCSWWALGK